MTSLMAGAVTHMPCSHAASSKVTNLFSSNQKFNLLLFPFVTLVFVMHVAIENIDAASSKVLSNPETSGSIQNVIPRVEI